jgi:GNAT superfamily N-acetyltransferase
MTVEIRGVRPEEYAVLGDLTVAAYLTVGAQAYPAYLEYIRDVAARAAACPTLVAVDDGRVIGGVTYVPGPGTPYSEVESEGDAGFRMLAVDPAAQGRGAGRLLVEACIERARREGKRRIVLLTTEPMVAAQRLYAGLGFRRAPELDWRPEPNVALLGFALDLTGPA